MPTPIGINWGPIWADGIWGAVWAQEAGGDPETISISADTPNVSIAKGGIVDITVTLVRGGGFAGDVTLAVAGLAAGVSETYLTDDTFTGSETTKVIRLSVDGGASTVSNDAYTITASATGPDDSVVNGTVSITEPPSSGGGTRERRRRAIIAVIRHIFGWR